MTFIHSTPYNKDDYIKEVVILKKRAVCFTGHREIPITENYAITRRLRKTLVELIEQGYCWFFAGGALGFDTIAAQGVLDLKQAYPHIRLILVLPCKSQAESWNESSLQMYELIKSRADRVEYIADRYYNGCMHTRNRHLVDNSSVCVCYLTKEKGGTFYTVNYAKGRNLKIINIAK